MQHVYCHIEGETRRLKIPPAHALAMDGVRWGNADEFFTPAFWKVQAWQHEASQTYGDLKLGRTLTEEVAACLLGAFGMPAEYGLAAYARLRERELLRPDASEGDIGAALTEPLMVRGRQRAYRFARQRARYLSATLTYLAELSEPEDDADLRDALTAAPGVGFKTASWVVRNYRNSDLVAVLDVHVVRACGLVGLFSTPTVTPTNYARLEGSFLAFAKAIDVRASLLDALIWDYMRRIYAPEPMSSAQLLLL